MDELRTALELATDDELEGLTDILFRRQLNPLDYMYAPEPIDVCSQDRDLWLDSLEERFRFLAADGVTVLRGKTRQVSYRQVLIQVCRHLKIPYNQSLSTPDLEAEIFLILVGRAWKQLPTAERRVLNGRLQQAVSQADISHQLPASLQQDPLGLVLKGSGVVAVNSVIRPWLMQTVARQFALHAATYQLAKEAAVQGGLAVTHQATLQAARRGVVASAARYGTTRTVLAVLGPALWALFFADLGWRAIATNYARVIPVVFTLAQIRLIRSAECQPA